MGRTSELSQGLILYIVGGEVTPGVRKAGYGTRSSGGSWVSGLGLRSGSAPLTTAYALLPQVLIKKRPALLQVFKQNNLDLLSAENVVFLSANADRLKTMEVRFLRRSNAPVDPLDVYRPAHCADVVRLFFPNTRISEHDNVTNCGTPPVDDANRSVLVELLRSSRDIPCAFGPQTDGLLLHFVVGLQQHGKDLAEPLLENGADPNSVDSELLTPLFTAVRARNPGAVQLLLKYGASPSGSGEVTVLEQAFKNSQNGFTGILQYLLERCYVRPDDLEASLQTILRQIRREMEASATSGGQKGNPRRCQVLGQHLVKVLALWHLDKFPFLDEEWATVVEKLVHSEFRFECELEVRRLRKERFGVTDVSVHGFLVGNDERLFRLLGQKSSAEDFKSQVERFPLFGNILGQHFEKVEDRLWLCKRSSDQGQGYFFGASAREVSIPTKGPELFLHGVFAVLPVPLLVDLSVESGTSLNTTAKEEEEMNVTRAPKRPASQDGNSKDQKCLKLGNC